MAGIEKSNANLRRALRHFHLLDRGQVREIERTCEEFPRTVSYAFFLQLSCVFLPLSHFRTVSYGTELDLTVSRCIVLARILVFFCVSGSQVSVPYQDANNLNSPLLMLSGQDGKVRGHLEMPPGTCTHVFVRYFVIDQFV